MRPPEFTGGNNGGAKITGCRDLKKSFNEAAGIHRRKHVRIPARPWYRFSYVCFNEAAGIHRRKLFQALTVDAPPAIGGFNEAAGIHRRKRAWQLGKPGTSMTASMRPPEFTGGNLWIGIVALPPVESTGGFNEAAGIHRRKRSGRSRRNPRLQ